MGLIVVPLAAAISKPDSANPTSTESILDPAPPLAFARARLVPLSARVVSRCRLIQSLARVPLLCPTLLPRATVGYPGLPPSALSVQAITNSFGWKVAGVDIGYGAPWEGSGWRAHRWRNRPCCFLHFNVFRRASGRRAVPTRARPATAGGKHGLLVPAREGTYYGSELYSANHVRFLWRAAGANWVATLHTFGESATEQLLGRLIASLRPVDTIGPREVRGVPVGRAPNAIARRGGSIWVASLGRLSGNTAGADYGTVYRVNRATARITGRVHPAGGGGPHALGLTRGAVWAATYLGIARIDPSSVRRVSFLGVGRFPKAIATAAGRVWVTRATPFGKKGALVSVEPDTSRRVGRPITLGRAPTAVAAGPGGLWVVDELDGTATRVDPRRRRIVARVNVGRMPTAVAVSAGSVWVANTGDGTVSRIDTRNDRVAGTFRVGPAPRGVTVGAGAVWVATTGDGKVRRIDPASGQVTAVARGLVNPLALLVDHGTVWVGTNDGRLIRARVP
jgi:YVTN family beta-propeller protein